MKWEVLLARALLICSDDFPNGSCDKYHTFPLNSYKRVFKLSSFPALPVPPYRHRYWSIMAEEHNKLQDKTSLIESKNQRSRPDLTSNSLSVNAGSQSATLDPEASMNDMGGHYQQHHSQPVQEADRREENSPPRAEEHAQLQRWAYETSNSELTPAERFEKQKWGNEGRSSVNKSEENKRE